MIIGMFLGMVMVLGILGVVVMVRMYSDIKKLKRELRGQEQINQSICHRFDELDQVINRRIDGEIRRTDDLYTDSTRYINKHIEEVYKVMDSRLDRLTNKLNPVKKDLLQD